VSTPAAIEDGSCSPEIDGKIVTCLGKYISTLVDGALKSSISICVVEVHEERVLMMGECWGGCMLRPRMSIWSNRKVNLYKIIKSSRELSDYVWLIVYGWLGNQFSLYPLRGYGWIVMDLMMGL
jgi:hypothetical protein